MHRPRVTYTILWCVAATIVGVLVSVAAAQDRDAHAAALGSARVRVASAADNAEVAVNRFLLSIDVLLSTLAAYNNHADRDKTLAVIARSHLALRDLLIADEQGQVMASAMSVTQRLGVQLPPGFLAQVLSSPAPALTVSTPSESFATSETVVYFARRMAAPPGGLIAIASVPAPQVQASLGNPQQGLTLTLERYDGEKLVAAPQRGVPASVQVSRTPMRASSGGRAQFARSGVDGKGTVFAARALVHPGLLVAASVPQELALEGWTAARRNLAYAVAFLTSLVLAAAALAHWTLYRMHHSTRRISLAKQWLDQAIDSVPEGILLRDEQERVVGWNNRYLEFYPWLRTTIRRGIPYEQLVRVSVQNLFPDATAEHQADLVRQQLAVRCGPAAQFEHPIGNEGKVQVTERRTPAGGTVSVLRDITGAERALEAARAAAEAARSTSQRFVSSVRDELHDTAVSVLSLMHRSLEATPAFPRRTLFQAAYCQAQQLVSDIVDLHELFLLESTTADPGRDTFSLSPLLQRSCRHAQEFARARNVAFEIRLPRTCPAQVVADARRLAQLSYATVRAAVAALPPGSRLTVEWSCEPLSSASDRHRLSLSARAESASTAAAAVSALTGATRVTHRPNAAIRLAQRLAEVLDGELLVGGLRSESPCQIAALWTAVDAVAADVEIPT